MGVLWLILFLVTMYRFIKTNGKVVKSYMRFRMQYPDVFRGEKECVFFSGNDPLIYTFYIMKKKYRGIGALEQECEVVRREMLRSLAVIAALFLVTLITIINQQWGE